MSFQDVDRKPTQPTSPRMRRNHPPKLPRVKAIPFSPASNKRTGNKFGSGSRWKQVVNGGRYERVQSSAFGSPSDDSPKQHDDQIVDPDGMSMSQSDDSSILEDDSNIDSRNDSESFGPDRYQSRDTKKYSSSNQIRLQQKEREANRRSNFAILTYEMQQYQKLVSDLEHLLKEAGESPEAAWRANILVKSVEDTDTGLLEKLDDYEKMLVESSHEKGSVHQQKNDFLLAQQISACSKLRRDYNRCHATMKSGIAVHRKRQTVEMSQLGAVHWNDAATGASAHPSDGDFFDRAMRQKELERINKSMREVHDIYHGLAGLVEKQQEQIDEMEDNASYAAANVKRGTDEYLCYSQRQKDLMCGALNGCGDDDDVAITMSYDLPPDGLRVSENFYWSMPLETMTQDLRSVKNDILGIGKDLVGVVIRECFDSRSLCRVDPLLLSVDWSVADMLCATRTVLPLTSRTALSLQRCFASNATEKYYTEDHRLSDFLEHRKQLVACSIKMNVGGDESHVPVLAKLILMAQDLFAKREPKPLPHPLPVDNFEQTATGIYKTIDFTCVGALVDTHMDPDSNRSSLHLVGPVEHLVEITNELILTAVTEFRKRKRGCKLDPADSTKKSISKVIDIIDNVTFLPLVPGTQGDICARKKIYSPTWIPTYPSWGARQVGRFMQETADIHVFFHHLAHRRNLSLSEIADQRNDHFKSNSSLREAAYVGAFKDFVEDFHIILSSSCKKRRALSLAEVLNSTSYGLSGVEATVEQYNKDLWDVHCRLLRPHITGSTSGEVELAAKRWRNLQPEREDQKSNWILKFIRVGSNYNHCLKLLEDLCLSEEKRGEHDASVMQSFRHCCSQYYPALSAITETSV